MLGSNRTVRIRLLDEGNIILTLEREEWKTKTDGTTFLKPSKWGLPGGQIKIDESPLKAAVRELLEEVCVEADIDPEPTVIRKEEDDHATFLFHARNPRPVSSTIRDSSILDVRWIPWKMAYGTFEFQVREYPIYNSHAPLIHQYFD